LKRKKEIEKKRWRLVAFVSLYRVTTSSPEREKERDMCVPSCLVVMRKRAKDKTGRKEGNG
jgi:hypothetical protein